MESMTNAPYLIPKARGGYRIGHGMMFDHMMLRRPRRRLLAQRKDRRRPLDGHVRRRVRGQVRVQPRSAGQLRDRIGQARAGGHKPTASFKWEIAPVTVTSRAGDTVIDKDEGPLKAKVDKIPTLRGVQEGRHHHRRSSSSINDGAAALVMMRESTAKQLGLTPIARIVGHATHAQEPNLFTTAPIGADEKLFKKIGWGSKDVDLFEINEAFAAVPMAAMRDLDIPHSKVNVHGGACALGHPIGASGARIIVTLLGALKRTGGKRGVARCASAAAKRPRWPSRCADGA
jgi:acetyl-CoA C-acetyltransferase